jgi:hypothetical protein
MFFFLECRRENKSKQAKIPRILSHLTSMCTFGCNASSKSQLEVGGGGGTTSRPAGSRGPSSHAALSDESCGISTRPCIKGTSSSTASSGCTEDTSSNFSGSVRSLEVEYTSSTLLAEDQEMLLSWSALPDEEWGHFVDFQEEPDGSWVGVFLNRQGQKRKA